MKQNAITPILALVLACSFLFSCQQKLKPVSSYANYLQQRKALLQKDSLLYFNHNIILSKQEQRLDQKLSALKNKMVTSYKADHFFPPARNFYLSKKHIESTPLFSILKKMPKGGILHLHADAASDADWMLDKMISTPEMYVYWGEENNQFTKGQMHAYKKQDVPEGFVQAQQLNAQFPNFREELKSLITFDNSMDGDSVAIWNAFNHVFQRITGFVEYKPFFVDFITHNLQILANDNIQHAELRLPFFNPLYDLEHPRDESNMEEYVAFWEQIKTNIQQTDPAFTFTIIHTNLRFRNHETIWKDIQRIYKNKRKYPQWLKGYDLVAEEDQGHPTLYHAKQFLALDSLEKIYNIELPLFLHDGESNWASVDNLYDAILLGTKRIGHGYNLFLFPTLMDMVKEKDICVEISPLSNQILGYVRDLRNHPAATYLRRGINCSISSDDPLIFDYEGLTYDYWSVYLAWNLDLASLKNLSKNGIVYSTLDADKKKKALQVWEERWEEFVRKALEEL